MLLFQQLVSRFSLSYFYRISISLVCSPFLFMLLPY